MVTSVPLLFALHESQPCAIRVAKHLALPLGTIEEHRYEDGEYKCHPIDPVAGRNVVVFAGLYPESGLSVHDKLCRLLFLCSAIKDAGARHLQVVAPYLCYSRKERRVQAQDPVITRYLATLMEASGVEGLITLDVHNQAAFDNAFRIPTRQLESAQLFAEHFKSGYRGEVLVVASPDLGGVKRAERFRQVLEQLLGQSIERACVEKYRSDENISGSMLVGNVRERTVILFDDMISTGATLLRAAETCHTAGAQRIYAMAAHALFTTGTELLESPLFERIVVSDSIPSPTLEPAVQAGHVDVLDTSTAIAAALASQYTIEVAAQ